MKWKYTAYVSSLPVVLFWRNPSLFFSLLNIGNLGYWHNEKIHWIQWLEVLFLPENYNVEIIEFMQNSHKWYSFFEHQCSWDCNISSYDWHFLSPLYPLLMKMLNRSQGALLLDRATGAWACCGREAAGEWSRAVSAPMCPSLEERWWPREVTVPDHCEAQSTQRSSLAAVVIVFLVYERGVRCKMLQKAHFCYFMYRISTKTALKR